MGMTVMKDDAHKLFVILEYSSLRSAKYIREL